MRIGVLSNVKAGRSSKRMDRVLAEVHRHPDLLHLETHSNRMVPDAVSALASENIDLLVINGGDGTVQHVLTELLSEPRREWLPILAPLRGGRTNMIALDFGARRDAARALRKLVEDNQRGLLEARVMERGVLRVDLGAGTGVRYGMFFGAGVLHRAIQLTHRSFPEGRAQGVFGASLVTLALLARIVAGKTRGILDPDKIQIALERTPTAADEYVLTMATTLDRLFLRMRPFWGTEDAPIKVTTLTAAAQRLATAVPGVMRGRPPAWATPEAGFASHNAEEVALRLDCGVLLDGELFEPAPDRLVTLSAADRVRFVRA